MQKGERSENVKNAIVFFAPPHATGGKRNFTMGASLPRGKQPPARWGGRGSVDLRDAGELAGAAGDRGCSPPIDGWASRGGGSVADQPPPPPEGEVFLSGGSLFGRRAPIQGWGGVYPQKKLPPTAANQFQQKNPPPTDESVSLNRREGG